MKTLDCIEIETHPNPQTSVIWLHGLGADGNDFASIPDQLRFGKEHGIRFIFPHAPVQAVTINAGMHMRAWYDILGLDRGAQEDRAGILQSEAAIHELISREKTRQVNTDNIYLAGFSQGGAMALFTGLRYPQRLGGIIGLSCYLPITQELETTRHHNNQTTPIFLAHGTHDMVVQYKWGQQSRMCLEQWEYHVDWKEYPIDHGVCVEEITELDAWFLEWYQN